MISLRTKSVAAVCECVSVCVCVCECVCDMSRVGPGRVCLWFTSYIRAGFCSWRPDVAPAAAAQKRNPCQPYYPNLMNPHESFIRAELLETERHTQTHTLCVHIFIHLYVHIYLRLYLNSLCIETVWHVCSCPLDDGCVQVETLFQSKGHSVYHLSNGNVKMSSLWMWIKMHIVIDTDRMDVLQVTQVSHLE